MRILIVCSGNAPNFDLQKHQAFIYDQVESLKEVDATLEFDYFLITGKGLWGYLLCFPHLLQQLRRGRYHLIHAHVVMASLLATMQRRVPVVTTFHGSDINDPRLRMLSLLADVLSRKTIYVSQQLKKKAVYASPKKSFVIPCGVNFSLFMPRSKQQSRQQLGLSPDRTYILFSSGFDNPVKNYGLAKKAIDLLKEDTIELLELKNYTRADVALLLTAVDLALITSFSEGSSQFLKEALACNCPVVSTDVGDARVVMGNIEGCYITSYKPDDVAASIRSALTYQSPLQSRDHMGRFDNQLIAKQIRDVYSQC
ncbi:glycosyltransferase [Spirosoma validum]|uniref:Glycosyltransferase n=1 Tax=Spirosoma validum TaxID=2771355 RepID=A0A927AZG9_9BACT|nr:glycosyltransferase [Spirosoma validum]MBD2752583.1 glycosyltransferase [Spirosoma validum]